MTYRVTLTYEKTDGSTIAAGEKPHGSAEVDAKVADAVANGTIENVDFVIAGDGLSASVIIDYPDEATAQSFISTLPANRTDPNFVRTNATSTTI